jgi:hypothetical protein
VPARDECGRAASARFHWPSISRASAAADRVVAVGPAG